MTMEQLAEVLALANADELDDRGARIVRAKLLAKRVNELVQELVSQRAKMAKLEVYMARFDEAATCAARIKLMSSKLKLEVGESSDPTVVAQALARIFELLAMGDTVVRA